MADKVGFTPMKSVTLAATIIQQSDRDHPADAVLRTELKNRRDLLPVDTAEIAGAVFSFYRWQGWLDERASLEDRIVKAMGLARKFSADPKSFGDDELVARAVPTWIHDEMPITPEFVRMLQTEPMLWLRARPGQGGILAPQLGECRAFGTGA